MVLQPPPLNHPPKQNRHGVVPALCYSIRPCSLHMKGLASKATLIPTKPLQWNCFDDQNNKSAKRLFFFLILFCLPPAIVFMLLTDRVRMAKLSAKTRHPEGGWKQNSHCWFWLHLSSFSGRAACMREFAFRIVLLQIYSKCHYYFLAFLF